MSKKKSVSFFRKVGGILFHGNENIVMTYFSTVMYELSFIFYFNFRSFTY